MIQTVIDRWNATQEKARIAELESEVARLNAEIERLNAPPAPAPAPEEPAKRIFPSGKPFRIGAPWRHRKATAEYERNTAARRVAAAIQAEQEFKYGIHNEIGQDVRESANG